MTGWLTAEELARLHGLACALQLEQRRSTLLAFDPGLSGKMETAATPAAQLLNDLHALNLDATVKDGELYFESWLRNAELLEASRPEAEQLAALRRTIAERRAHQALELRGAIAPGARDGDLRLVSAKRSKRARRTIVAVSAALACAALGLALYPRSRPANTVDARLGLATHARAWSGPLPREAAVLRVRQFELSSAESTYEEVAGERRSFKPSESAWAELREQGCRGVFAPDRLEAARRALLGYGRRTRAAELLRFPEDARWIGRDSPIAAAALVPAPSEWAALEDGDRRAIGDWVSACLFLPQPTFSVSLENSSDTEQVITSVIYRNRPGRIDRTVPPYGPIHPAARYIHALAWGVEAQVAPLTPPFRIGPRTTGSLTLTLLTHQGRGREWLLDLYFTIDSERGAAIVRDISVDISAGGPGPSDD